MVPAWSRRSVLPFLLLAYPFTYLLFQGGRYCIPVCFEPTLFGVGKVVGALLAFALVAGVVGVTFNVDRGRSTYLKYLVPSPSASVILLALFGLFVAFLTLDTLSMYEGVWKPFVLPISFLLFLPVWMLYIASFPLAILFSLLGVESTPVMTLTFQGIVLFIGFPLSAVFQTAVISAIMDGVQSQD